MNLNLNSPAALLNSQAMLARAIAELEAAREGLDLSNMSMTQSARRKAIEASFNCMEAAREDIQSAINALILD